MPGVLGSLDLKPVGVMMSLAVRDGWVVGLVVVCSAGWYLPGCRDSGWPLD